MPESIVSARLLKAVLKAAVVAYVKVRSGGLAAEIGELEGLGVGHGERLLEHDVLPARAAPSSRARNGRRTSSRCRRARPPRPPEARRSRGISSSRTQRQPFRSAPVSGRTLRISEICQVSVCTRSGAYPCPRVRDPAFLLLLVCPYFFLSPHIEYELPIVYNVSGHLSSVKIAFHAVPSPCTKKSRPDCLQYRLTNSSRCSIIYTNKSHAKIKTFQIRKITWSRKTTPPNGAAPSPSPT